MKKFGKGLLGLVLVVGLLAMFGCSLVQDTITPCHVGEEAIEYAGIKGTSYVPWTTVFDAKRVRGYMNFNHVQYQTTYDRAKQDDTLRYTFISDGLNVHIADATAFQQKVFSPTSPVGLLLPTLLGGTLGSLFIKRPGDKSKKELETYMEKQ